MFRWLSIVISVVLLLSSAGFADINQHENFGIGANNGAHVVGCGSACNLNLVGFVQGQKVSELCSRSRACQIGGAIIGQCAMTYGRCAAACVRQGATVSGCQDQSLDTCRSRCCYQSATQDQNLILSFRQNVSTHGAGGAFGAQGGIAAQHQTLVTPRGVGTQSQFVGVVQIGAVGGGRGSNASVSQSVNVTTSQHQSF
jgi:hypothetical protein